MHCQNSELYPKEGEFYCTEEINSPQGGQVGAKLDQVLAFLETTSLKIPNNLFCDVILLNYSIV